MKQVRTVLQRWQARCLHLISFEIIFQYLPEFDQQLLIGFATGDELAFVEAGAIIQQQLDVLGDDCFAVAIDGMQQFLPDVFEAFRHFLLLPGRDMEGFVGIVMEERIIRYVLPERCATDQIGMEGKHPAFGRQHILFAVAECLTRGEKQKRTARIVVILASVLIIATLALPEQDGVKPELDALLHLLGVREVNDADQRMKRLLPQVAVALMDCSYLYCFIFHINFAFCIRWECTQRVS